MTSTVWTDRELAAARQLVAGQLAPATFVARFLEARDARLTSEERPGQLVEDLLDDIFYLVDAHNPSDRTREPDELDDDQLREGTARLLDEFDAGTYVGDPRSL